MIFSKDELALIEKNRDVIERANLSDIYHTFYNPNSSSVTTRQKIFIYILLLTVSVFSKQKLILRVFDYGPNEVELRFKTSEPNSIYLFGLGTIPIKKINKELIVVRVDQFLENLGFKSDFRIKFFENLTIQAPGWLHIH